MKGLIFSLLLLTSLSTAAQSIESVGLRANGFTGNDSTKNYIIIEVPKVTKADLYKRALVYFNGLYKNPQKVISTVDGESIVINGYTDVIKGELTWYNYDLNYNLNIQFKDGKVRFEPKIVDLFEIWSKKDPPRKYYVNSVESSRVGEVNAVYIGNRSTGTSFLFIKPLKASLDNWINNYLAAFNKALNDTW